MYLKIFGLTCVLIFAISGAIIFGTFMFLENMSPGLMAAGSVICLGFTWWSLRAILKINQEWISSFRAKFEEHPDQVLVRWEVPPDIWLDFCEQELKRERNERPLMGWIFGGIVALVVVLVAWDLAGFGGAMIWAIVIGLPSGLAAMGVDGMVSRRQYRWRRRQDEVRIWIRPDGMRINEKVVAWNQFGSRLIAAGLEPGAEGALFHILQLVVRIPTGRSSNDQIHRVPVPPGSHPEVSQAVRGLGWG